MPPLQFDLRPNDGPIDTQGSTCTCTAYAACTMVRMVCGVELSPDVVFHNTLEVEGVADTTLGSCPTHTIQALQTMAIPATFHQLPQTLDAIRGCIASGYPFMFGFNDYLGFDSHVALAVGYTPSHFIIRNSWGAGWGDKGYFHMPYAVIANPTMSRDFWTARRTPVAEDANDKSHRHQPDQQQQPPSTPSATPPPLGVCVEESINFDSIFGQ